MGQTSKDIFRHLEDATLENDRLRRENKKLRLENQELRVSNKRLHKRIEALEATMEERIKQSVAEAVAKAIEPLHKIIAEKDNEILRLKTQINKDSSNSSKPTTSNGFKKVPNNREKSGKKQGGQQGHKGTRLNIPADLDELVAAGKAEHVITSEVSEGEKYVSDWTIDIKIVTVYTEHRRKPGKPPKIEYGLQLRAVAVYLSVIGLISYNRLSQFFHELTDNLITVSKATLEGFVRSASRSINLTPLVQDLLNGKVINVDETPIKTTQRPDKDGNLKVVEKTTSYGYIRTYSNDMTTVLTANPFKTEESINTDNILTQFHGIISQDHEAKFYNFGNANATCGTHLTRELLGMYQLQMLTWAEDVRQFFLEMNKYKKEDLSRGSIACDPSLLCQFEARYDEHIKVGREQLSQMKEKTFGYDSLRRMVNRLEKYKHSYLLFIRNYDAPFTNNQAERDLRHCKTKQKVSGCFRTWGGVIDYCKISSLLITTKKRGGNLLLALSSLWVCSVPAGQ